MYRPDEMAQILELAKQEAKKHQLGGKETVTLTFDGNIDGKQMIDFDGTTLVKVSDDPFSIPNNTQVKKLEMKFGGVIKDYTSVSTYIYEGPVAAVMVGDIIIVLIVYENRADVDIDAPPGVYFLGGDENNYVTSFSCMKITPIPQEYIPPLDRLILNGADGNQYALTITDGAISVAPVTT